MTQIDQSKTREELNKTTVDQDLYEAYNQIKSSSNPSQESLNEVADLAVKRGDIHIALRLIESGAILNQTSLNKLANDQLKLGLLQRVKLLKDMGAHLDQEILDKLAFKALEHVNLRTALTLKELGAELNQELLVKMVLSTLKDRYYDNLLLRDLGAKIEQEQLDELLLDAYSKREVNRVLNAINYGAKPNQTMLDELALEEAQQGCWSWRFKKFIQLGVNLDQNRLNAYGAEAIKLSDIKKAKSLKGCGAKFDPIMLDHLVYNMLKNDDVVHVGDVKYLYDSPKDSDVIAAYDLLVEIIDYNFNTNIGFSLAFAADDDKSNELKVAQIFRYLPELQAKYIVDSQGGLLEGYVREVLLKHIAGTDQNKLNMLIEQEIKERESKVADSPINDTVEAVHESAGWSAYVDMPAFARKTMECISSPLECMGYYPAEDAVS